MRGFEILRIVLCGMIAGVLWFLLAGATLSLLGSDLLAAVQTNARGPRAVGAVFFSIDVGMGIWAVWIYSAIAPRFGRGLRTAAIAGLSWWLLKTLQSVKWIALGFLPAEVTLGPGIVTLVGTIAATIVGASLYERVKPGAAEHDFRVVQLPES